jgi:hypothetical protein
MMPVFLKTYPECVSYGVLHELAGLSGFRTVSVDSVREENVCYIGTLHSCVNLSGSKSKIVKWFLERPAITGDCATLFRTMRMNGVDEVWVSDRSIYNQNKELCRFVPIGSHEKLAPVSVAKKYDVAHMSFLNKRRSVILSTNCSKAPCFYDIERRSEALSASKFLLNVHQFDDQCSEPLRFALAAAAGIPIISETCIDPYPYEKPGIIQVPYSDIVGVVERLVREDYSKYREAGMGQRDRILRDFSFRDNVLKAVAGMKQ